jgi:hypothetical protein
MGAFAEIETAPRSYTPLPIDMTRGLPQTFSVLFGGRTYHFTLYANVAASRLDPKAARTGLELPSEDAFLVARVEREEAGGLRETIFLRKVVPGMEYEAGDIALTFPEQRVAPANLNGRGEFGSRVSGGIAPRWAS